MASTNLKTEEKSALADIEHQAMHSVQPLKLQQEASENNDEPLKKESSCPNVDKEENEKKQLNPGSFWINLTFAGFLSGFGVIIRILITQGMTNILKDDTNDENSIVWHYFIVPSLMTNIVGSYLLGCFKSIPRMHKFLSTMFGTGLCGCITTFSSFNFEIILLFFNDKKEKAINNNVALVIFYYILAIILTIGLSCVAFYFGTKMYTIVRKILSVCLQTEKNNNGSKKSNGNESININRKKLEYIWEKYVLIIIVGILILLIGITVSLSFLIDHGLWLAVILAPFGAKLRWFLGRMFNNKAKWRYIPVGTFAANIIGSLLLAILLSAYPNSTSDDILIEGITKGFCGCLTTVSSFIGELFMLVQKCKQGIIDSSDKHKNNNNGNKNKNNNNNNHSDNDNKNEQIAVTISHSDNSNSKDETTSMRKNNDSKSERDKNGSNEKLNVNQCHQYCIHLRYSAFYAFITVLCAQLLGFVIKGIATSAS